jgi:hypothetical protein
MRILLTVAMVLVMGCGGEDGVPVVSSSLSGSALGTTLSGVYGVALTNDSGELAVAIGTGEVHCGSLDSLNPPPSGTYLYIDVDDSAVGFYDTSSTFIVFYVISGDDADGHGANVGTVEITAVSEETVSMTVSYTEDDDGDIYQASGSFEVERCD